LADNSAFAERPVSFPPVTASFAIVKSGLLIAFDADEGVSKSIHLSGE
jgi:hypothetical protein